MSRSLLVRLLENFFRRWWLYLVPVVVLAVVGFLSVAGTKSKFQSTGTLNAESSTLLGTLSGTNQNAGFESPAETASKRMNASLQTDQFVQDIATRAGLDGALASGLITTNWIRGSLAAIPNGANLVRVVAVSEDAQVAQRLASSTIDAFVQSVIDSAASQTTAAVAFFDNLLTTYKADVEAATQALDAYVGDHPAPALGARPEDEQAEIARLNSALTQAQQSYNTTLSKSQDAKLSTEQTKADVGERLRLVDAPKVPSAPQPKLKSMVFGFATFLALGVLLSIGAVVVGTALDDSLLSAADVKERLGVRALAVVPDASGRRVRRVKTPAEPKAAKTPKAPKAPRQPLAPVTPVRAAAPAKKLGGVRRPNGVPAPTKVPTAARTRAAGQARHVSRAPGATGWPS